MNDKLFLSNPTIRVIHILVYFSERPKKSIGLTEISNALEMNKATCLSILKTLTLYGLLVQDEQTRHYKKGPYKL